jgi:hypothetical protein
MPFSFVSFTLSKYAYTGRKGPIAGQGRIRIHVTGLKYGGDLYALINNCFPPPENTLPFRYQRYDVSSDHLDVVINDVPYGQYVVSLWHDEKKKGKMEFKDGWPAFGTWISNEEKVDPRLGLKGFTFDVLKISFHEVERSFEAKMMYPPFPGQ